MILAVLYALFFSQVPKSFGVHHTSVPESAPTMDVNALFRHTTSRNHKVIMQAVEFVVSMQTAPTCTRLAASHLMKECKMLDHAPDFAKNQPDAYLDNIKTEYAAKLAVCELLSAQPINPMPPAHCEILVPSSKACGKKGGWWYAQPEVSSDKQCYPDFEDYQYTQCLKTLQSTPQFWTSFSNARQNAVVMCQASRDAIERENHLETFKNLTQVLNVVTSSMQKSTEQYESMVDQQKKVLQEASHSYDKAEASMQSLEEKALASVGAIDDKFHSFMESSLSDLTTALEQSQTTEIERISVSMQAFQQELKNEAADLAKVFTGEFHQYHQQSLHALKANFETQEAGFDNLSHRLSGMHGMVNRTSDMADRSLAKAEQISHRLDTFESQTEHIAEGVAFLNAIPGLVTTLVRGLLAGMGTLFGLVLLYKIHPALAVYTVGTFSAVFLVHISGVVHFLGALPTRLSLILTLLGGDSSSLSPAQKGLCVFLLLWIPAHPIYHFNTYLSRAFKSIIDRFVSTLR